MTKRNQGLWPEPRRTGNSALLAGYLCGALSQVDEPIYRAVELRGEGGPIIEHCDNGNRYLLHVVQISGTE